MHFAARPAEARRGDMASPKRAALGFSKRRREFGQRIESFANLTAALHGEAMSSRRAMRPARCVSSKNASEALRSAKALFRHWRSNQL
jgi:hypothetical protein